ncbi:MAG: hypothetical protein IJV95_03570 [Clostridia bacterium]|nr:hypothetical protein [Clostridia bacterium]
MSDEKFEYTYSAFSEEEKREAEYIRSRYLKKDKPQTKLDEIKKLDQKVKNFPTCIGLILGIVGTLIFGTGLTCILEFALVVLGVVLSVIGVGIACSAYFVYEKIDRRLRDKYADTIVSLSNEILEEVDE